MSEKPKELEEQKTEHKGIFQNNVFYFKIVSYKASKIEVAFKKVQNVRKKNFFHQNIAIKQGGNGLTIFS